MPGDLICIPARSDTIRHGAFLLVLCELAVKFGYVLVEATLFNAFFVLRHLYEEYLMHEVPDTTIKALHETAMGTQLYQLYDGPAPFHQVLMLFHIHYSSSSILEPGYKARWHVG